MVDAQAWGDATQQKRRDYQSGKRRREIEMTSPGTS